MATQKNRDKKKKIGKTKENKSATQNTGDNKKIDRQNNKNMKDREPSTNRNAALSTMPETVPTKTLVQKIISKCNLFAPEKEELAKNSKTNCENRSRIA